MNLPPVVYSKAFWQALAYIGAGVLGILVVLGKLPPQDALTPAAILAWFLALLKLVDVVPELRAKGRIR